MKAFLIFYSHRHICQMNPQTFSKLYVTGYLIDRSPKTCYIVTVNICTNYLLFKSLLKCLVFGVIFIVHVLYSVSIAYTRITIRNICHDSLLPLFHFCMFCHDTSVDIYLSQSMFSFQAFSHVYHQNCTSILNLSHVFSQGTCMFNVEACS